MGASLHQGLTSPGSMAGNPDPWAAFQAAGPSRHRLRMASAWLPRLSRAYRIMNILRKRLAENGGDGRAVSAIFSSLPSLESGRARWGRSRFNFEMEFRLPPDDKSGPSIGGGRFQKFAARRLRTAIEEGIAIHEI